MTAQLLRHESNTSPGGTIKVSVWVWSTTPARLVRATVATSAHALLTPRFTLCPVKRGTTCSIGSLPANQAFELMVTDHVRPTAANGKPFALAFTASARGFSSAQAAVAAVVGHGIQPPSSQVPLPPPTVFPIPGATVRPSGLSGLFPTVTPQATPSTRPSQRTRKVVRVAQTASSLPLDSRLIGGQLAALALLAAAITMVVARLSLRTAQTAPAGAGADGSGATGPGTIGTGATEPATTGSAEGDSSAGDPSTDTPGPDAEASDDRREG